MIITCLNPLSNQGHSISDYTNNKGYYNINVLIPLVIRGIQSYGVSEIKEGDAESKCLNPLSNQGHSISDMMIGLTNEARTCLNPLSNQGHSIKDNKIDLETLLLARVLIPLVIRVIQSIRIEGINTR